MEESIRKWRGESVNNGRKMENESEKGKSLGTDIEREKKENGKKDGKEKEAARMKKKKKRERKKCKQRDSTGK